MTTIEIIVAELRRQLEGNPYPHSIGWLEQDNPKATKIDGYVDLVALAMAIDTRRRAWVVRPDYDYDGLGEVEGVFSTRENAEKYMAQKDQSSLEIIEVEIDKPLTSTATST